MSTDFLSRASGLDAATVRDQIRKAHGQLDETRCVGWLRATGNRPSSQSGLLTEGERMQKGSQFVERRAKPYPLEACDMHPVEE